MTTISIIFVGVPVCANEPTDEKVIYLLNREIINGGGVVPIPEKVCFASVATGLYYSDDNKPAKRRVANLFYEHCRLAALGRTYYQRQAAVRLTDGSTYYTWLRLKNTNAREHSKPFTTLRWWELATNDFTARDIRECAKGSLVQYLGNSYEVQYCMWQCGYPWDICGLIEHEILLFM
jgi:hypothetical protein